MTAPAINLVSVDLPAPFSPTQRVDLALAEIEIDLLDGRHAAIGLGDFSHLEEGGRGAHPSAPCTGDASRRIAFPPFAAMKTLPPDFHRARHSMPRAIRAAVEARDRPQVLVEADEQPVGAARRPGLVDPHRANRAALQRLEEGAAWIERGAIQKSDPPRAPSRCGSLLLQHEFDQPVARCEERQPRATVRCRRQAAG